MRWWSAALVVLGLTLGCRSAAQRGPDGSPMNPPGTDPDQQDPRPDAGPSDAPQAEAYPPPTPTLTQPCRLVGVGVAVSMDLSPDGKLAAFGSTAGGVTLIGMEKFVALRTITAHPSSVVAVAFSKDSSTVASADSLGNVTLWSASNGGSVWTTSLAAAPKEMAFSPSGTLWAATADGLVALEAATGSHRAPAPGTGGATAFALSPDGQTLVLGGADGSFRLLRTAEVLTSGAASLTVSGANPGGVTALRISGNGQRIVSGGTDGTVALWDLQGKLIARVARPGVPPVSVDLNADGSLLVAGTSGPASAAAFRPDGTVLVEYIIFPTYTRLSIDGNYMVSLAGGLNRVELQPLFQTPGSADVWTDDFTTIAFSPDGELLAAGDWNDVRLWNTATGEMVRIVDTVPPLPTPAQAIAFSPDGVALARNGYNEGVHVFRVTDGALLATYRGNTSSRSLAYSPDGAWLATTGRSAAALWRTADGSSGPTTFTGTAGKRPTAVAFSANGATLAVGDETGTVSLWSFPDGALIGQFPALPNGIERVAFTPDGTHVAVSDRDRGHQAMFARDGALVATFPQALSPSFALSPDGQYFANVGYGPLVPGPGGLNYYSIEVILSSPLTGRPIQGLAPRSPEDKTLYFNGGVLAFDRTGRRLAVADLAGRIFCLP